MMCTFKSCFFCYYQPPKCVRTKCAQALHSFSPSSRPQLFDAPFSLVHGYSVHGNSPTTTARNGQPPAAQHLQQPCHDAVKKQLSQKSPGRTQTSAQCAGVARSAGAVPPLHGPDPSYLKRGKETSTGCLSPTTFSGISKKLGPGT